MRLGESTGPSLYEYHRLKVKSEGLSLGGRRLFRVVAPLMNMVNPEEPFSPVLTCPRCWEGRHLHSQKGKLRRLIVVLALLENNRE